MNTKPLYIVIAAVLAVGAWLFRYEVVGVDVGDYPPTVFRLDRWTGKMMAAQPSGTVNLEPIDREPVKAPNPFDRFDR